MNDLSPRPAAEPELFGPDDWEDDWEPVENGTAMEHSRKPPRQRLSRDSSWARRLQEVVARANTTAFTPAAQDRQARRGLFGDLDPTGDAGAAERPETWGNLRVIQPRARKAGQGGIPLAHHDRDGDVARAFDLLRTRLMQTLRQNGWSRIAVAAPTPGCGATFTAVNLALSLARVPGSRSILMDMNQRSPGVADALDVHGVGEMRHFLSGKVAMSQHLVRLSDTLALGLSTVPCPDSADLLHDRRTAEVLARMHTVLAPDVVLYDMPAILAHDDMGALLPQVDGVLLISDGTRTTARHIAECERVLAGQVPLLGVILNRARASSVRTFRQ